MSKNKVDSDLYDFLQNHETGLCLEKQGIIAYVHIPFYDLDDFVKTVGYTPFDENGLDVKMFDNTICIELNDIFEGDDNCILDYENCFCKDDVEHYIKYLLKEREED